MKNNKIFFALFLPIFFSCASPQQTAFLKDPELKTDAPQYISSFVPEFNFMSAKSNLENSSVEVGAWQISRGDLEVIRFDLKITNKTKLRQFLPREIVLLNANGQSAPFLSPQDFVHIIMGETSEEALAKAEAMSAYARIGDSNRSNSGIIYTYGTLYNNSFSTHSYYSVTTNRSSAGSFATGFARGYAMGKAMRSARISKMSRQAELTALRPKIVLPNSCVVGRVWCLQNELPVNLHIFVCNDHHIIKLSR